MSINVSASLRAQAIVLLLLISGTHCLGQNFFGTRRIRIGRLQLEQLHIREATVSQGEGDQGEYKQPVRLVFDSGRVTLLSTDSKSVLLTGTIAAGSSLSATFTCSGGPCVAPLQLSIGQGGMNLEVKVDGASLTKCFGALPDVTGAQVKIGSVTPLEIRKNDAEGSLGLRWRSFTLKNVSFRISTDSDVLVTDLSSSGETISNLDLGEDVFKLQSAKFVKKNFELPGSYRVALEGQSITGARLSARQITLDIPSKARPESPQQQPSATASLELSDLVLEKPSVKLAKYPDFEVIGVSKVTCKTVGGEIATLPEQPATPSSLDVKNLIAQPDPTPIINKLNATSQGKSILPTGNPNVRYIHAQVLKNLYAALGYSEDDQGSKGRTIYLPVKDGVIYDIIPGTYPISDPGTKDPPILVEAVGTIGGAVAGELGGELLGDLLKKPLAELSLGLSLNSMLLNPRLGVPTAWIVYNAGTFGTKKVGEKLGEVAAETVAEAGGEVVEDVLVEPVLHTIDVDTASALVKYLEVPPPAIPPSSIIVDPSNDVSRAQAFRKERIAFISTDALNSSQRQTLPPEVRARIESYERQLEWAVNNKFTFRQDVKNRIEPAWQSRQSQKITQFLTSANSVEDDRRRTVSSAAASNAAQSAGQEKLNDQQKAAAIGQMQQQMDGQMSGFGNGMSSSYGNYNSGNPLPSTPATGTSTGTGGTSGTMSQGQGCRDMYQGCFQQPGRIYFNYDDPFIITAKKPRRDGVQIRKP